MKKPIPINTESSIYFIDPDDVLYCKCKDASTTLNMINNESLVISRELDAVEELLEGNGFIRPHQSYLVNRNHILKIDIANDYTLILTNQEKIPTDVLMRKEMVETLKTGI
nr:LytTR family transcriptional regulator DNA-binding domain-containing protein [Bacteroidota bacterium]